MNKIDRPENVPPPGQERYDVNGDGTIGPGEREAVIAGDVMQAVLLIASASGVLIASPVELEQLVNTTTIVIAGVGSALAIVVTAWKRRKVISKETAAQAVGKAAEVADPATARKVAEALRVDLPVNSIVREAEGIKRRREIRGAAGYESGPGRGL